jgi:hypothetical protein
MPEYLVELYRLADADTAAFDGLVGGATVRDVRSIVIPGAETCLHLVRADSIEQVAEALRAVGLQADRIVEAFSHQTPGGTP